MGMMSGPAIGIVDRDLEDRRSATLERIAQLIDRPVEHLIHGLPPEDELGGAAELITLWHAIENPEDRKRLLAMTRDLAGH